MIHYNMRYRGPYEYDKFILNILQLANIINLSQSKELDNEEKQLDSLINLESQINTIYDKYIGTSSKMGLCEQQYISSFKINGGK